MTLSAPQLGKTRSVACWSIAIALALRGLHWWAAPTYKQVMPGFSTIKAGAQRSGLLLGTPITSSGNRSIRLINGSTIQFVSWEKPENLSGPSIRSLVCDEAHELTTAAWGVLRARRSSTMGPVRLIGNTGDIEGEFKRLCDIAADPQSDWGFYKWTWMDKYLALGGGKTAAGRAFKEMIEDERTHAPSWQFKSIWEAEWLESELAVFANVDAATSLASNPAPVEGMKYIIGIDLAETTDYTVMLPITADGSTRDVTFMRRFRRMEYPAVAQIAADLSKAWNDAVCAIEINGPGRPVYQWLRKMGVKVYPWTTTSQSKHQAVVDTAGDIEFGRMRLAPLPPLQAEIKSFRRTRTPSGNYVYKAPQGSHDDTVMALVIGNACRTIAQRFSGRLQRMRVSG